MWQLAVAVLLCYSESSDTGCPSGHTTGTPPCSAALGNPNPRIKRSSGMLLEARGRACAGAARAPYASTALILHGAKASIKRL
jgi:hypothetical protein